MYDILPMFWGFPLPAGSWPLQLAFSVCHSVPLFGFLLPFSYVRAVFRWAAAVAWYLLFDNPAIIVAGSGHRGFFFLMLLLVGTQLRRWRWPRRPSPLFCSLSLTNVYCYIMHYAIAICLFLFTYRSNRLSIIFWIRWIIRITLIKPYQRCLSINFTILVNVACVCPPIAPTLACA